MFSLFLVLVLGCSSAVQSRTAHAKGASAQSVLLQQALDGLESGLDFMADNVQDLNIDAVGVIRLIQSHLSQMIKNKFFASDSDLLKRVKKLTSSARDTADAGMLKVTLRSPKYSKRLKKFMEEPKQKLWYPSIDAALPNATPLPCNESYFDTDVSDSCFEGLLSNSGTQCSLKPGCSAFMTDPGMKSYRLTHQVLFYQMMQMMGCVDEVAEGLRIRLCSDVLRDAKQIAQARFPVDIQDLFAEQVSLCGLWGFRDFYNPEWLKAILSWQGPNGCFSGKPAQIMCYDEIIPDPVRKKRNEFIMKENCLAHKSTLCLLALSIHIRFFMEAV